MSVARSAVWGARSAMTVARWKPFPHLMWRGASGWVAGSSPAMTVESQGTATTTESLVAKLFLHKGPQNGMSSSTLDSKAGAFDCGRRAPPALLRSGGPEKPALSLSPPPRLSSMVRFELKPCSTTSVE